MKNHLRAPYCNQCGGRLEDSRAPKDADGRAKLYADIAHPINSACREMIQNYVIQEYYNEIERAKQPGYVSRYDDFDFEFVDISRRAQARFDQPHGFPGSDQPHITAKTSGPHDGRSSKPHYRGDGTGKRGATPPHAEPQRGDSFGAGIFPE
jgi:stage V sporulation protein G